ncbi:hypothetical protein IJS77_03345 [bacterium]|nr:hypothetical protein [bacterium]
MEQTEITPLPQEYFNQVQIADDLFYDKKFEEALNIYLDLRKQINENYPNDMGLLSNCIANCYYNMNDYDKAIPYYETTIKYLPQFAEVWSMLGFLYFKKDIEKSINYYIKGMDLKPTADNYMTVCMQSIKLHQFSQKDLKEMFEKYVNALRPTLMKGKQAYTYNPKDYDKNKKLKIGYLSSDFYCHAMMSFILPIIENHDFENYDIVFYGTNEKKDFVTERIKNFNGENADISKMDNAQIADKIHEDKVDILVDISGYTNKKAIWSLLYKPAPVIIQYLGYLGTFGMKEVDYIITDEITIPKDVAPYYTEKPLYLNSQMNKFMFQTDNIYQAPIVPLPYDKNGYITFGSYNCRSKLNSYTISLWSKALNAVPNSKMLMFRTNFEEHDRKRLIKQFGENGVSADRIMFETKLPQLHVNCYSMSDVAFDPSPFSGLTITIEQAFMGLPTLTMPGETISSKGTARVNMALGLYDYIAANEEDFVQKAINIANNIDKLRYDRINLRKILRDSYLFNDYKAFSQEFEKAYKRAWTEFCDKN